MAEKNIYGAVATARGQIEDITRDLNNSVYNSKYASLDAIWKAIRKPLSDNGLCIIQQVERVGETFIMKVPVRNAPPKDALGCWIRITTTIAHESGQTIELTGVDLPCEANAQKIGAAITYGKRYGLSAALGLSTEDDDDGNSISVDSNLSVRNYSQSAPPNFTKKEPVKAEQRKYAFKEPKGKFQYTDKEIDTMIKYVKTMTIKNCQNIFNKVMEYDYQLVTDTFNSELKIKKIFLNDETGKFEEMDNE